MMSPFLTGYVDIFALLTHERLDDKKTKPTDPPAVSGEKVPRNRDGLQIHLAKLDSML